MAYITPIRGASSIRHALKIKFLKPEEDCLVIAKSNRLEIYEYTSEDLVLSSSHTLHGRPTLLHRLQPASSSTEHLFVATDSSGYFTVSWDANTRQLKTERSYVDLAEKAVRTIQTDDRCNVDPKGRMLILELFEGVLTVIPILHRSKKRAEVKDEGNIGECMNLRITEFSVRSSAFLSSYTPPAIGSKIEKAKLALLYEDSYSKVKLRIKELSPVKGDPNEYEVEDNENPAVELDAGASLLIPLSAPASGVVILGEVAVSYNSGEDEIVYTEPLPSPTIFVTWVQIDEQRYVIADDYGKLHLLMIELDSEYAIKGFHWTELGVTSRASVLIYFDNGILFLGSHQGDSQLIKIFNGSLEILKSIPNIAPILDFTVMDMGNRLGEGQMNEFSSGQARIVCGSGAFQDGSLRSVRSGVRLDNLGILGEMENVVDLFSFRSSIETEKVDAVAVSFISETRIFHFSPDGDVEELEELANLQLSGNTLLLLNIEEERLLQITSRSARLIDLNRKILVSQWSPEGSVVISGAAANGQYVLLSLEGQHIVSLRVNTTLEMIAERHYGDENQISCIHVPEIATPNNIGFIGFWQSSSIAIVDLENLVDVHQESISNTASVPRSILLTQLLAQEPPILIIALADGNVYTYACNLSNMSLSDRNSTILGTHQATLRAIPKPDGLYIVFAACDHPSVIYGSEERIIYSATTAEDVTCVCSFDSDAFADAIVLATSSDLSIATIDTGHTTHVQTLSINETVRRIAYSPILKAFGLGTIKRHLEGNEEIVESHFKLVDEVLFKELDTFSLNTEELVESVTRAQLDGGDGTPQERYIVGTAYLDDNEHNARGRLIILEMTEDRQLKMVTQLSVKGACRCLGVMEDKIVAALVKTVVIYSFSYPTKSQPHMGKLASFRASTAPIDIAISGNRIAVADLMKSVSILEFKKGEEGLPDSLSEIARHLTTAWGTAVAEVDKDTYLESDAEGNILVLARNLQGVTEEDRKKLTVTSHISLGEMVNRIRPINVRVSADPTVIPRAFMATVEGSIYLFALICPWRLDLLITFQNQLAALVHTPGNMSFEPFRAIRSMVWDEKEPFRFVDGEMIERYLDCSTEIQEKAIEGLEVSVDDMKSIIEGLRRLH